MPKLQERAAEHAEQHKKAMAARPSNEKPPYVSGHCQTASLVSDGTIVSTTDGREWHGNCRGSVVNGNGTVLLCACSCHENHTVCRNCGRFDVELVTEGGGSMIGTCVDVEGCANVLAERARNNPIGKYLTADQERRVAKRLREEHPGLPGSEPADAGEGAREGTKRPSRPARSKGGVPQRCHCGCGTMTKGGNFAMGHDMKLKGRLFEAARGKGADDPVAVMCAAEIAIRSWNETGIRDEVRTKAREEYAGMDVMHFVGKRYSGG